MATHNPWEYRVIVVGTWWSFRPEAAEEQLNELGAEGWEVISTHRDNLDRMVAVAKRPLSLASRRRQSYPEAERG